MSEAQKESVTSKIIGVKGFFPFSDGNLKFNYYKINK